MDVHSNGNGFANAGQYVSPSPSPPLTPPQDLENAERLGGGASRIFRARSAAFSSSSLFQEKLNTLTRLHPLDENVISFCNFLTTHMKEQHVENFPTPFIITGNELQDAQTTLLVRKQKIITIEEDHPISAQFLSNGYVVMESLKKSLLGRGADKGVYTAQLNLLGKDNRPIQVVLVLALYNDKPELHELYQKKILLELKNRCDLLSKFKLGDSHQGLLETLRPVAFSINADQVDRSMYGYIDQVAVGGENIANSSSGKTLKERHNFVISAVQGLITLHEKGYAHCDVKIANLNLYDKTRIAWSDYSQMQQLTFNPGGPKSWKAKVGGTQLCRNSGGSLAQGDIHGIAIVIFQLLTGQPFMYSSLAYRLPEFFDSYPPECQQYGKDCYEEINLKSKLTKLEKDLNELRGGIIDNISKISILDGKIATEQQTPGQYTKLINPESELSILRNELESIKKEQRTSNTILDKLLSQIKEITPEAIAAAKAKADVAKEKLKEMDLVPIQGIWGKELGQKMYDNLVKLMDISKGEGTYTLENWNDFFKTSMISTKEDGNDPLAVYYMKASESALNEFKSLTDKDLKAGSVREANINDEKSNSDMKDDIVELTTKYGDKATEIYDMLVELKHGRITIDTWNAYKATLKATLSSETDA